MPCATWSSPSNCCAAGISLDFFRDIDVCQDETGLTPARHGKLNVVYVTDLHRRPRMIPMGSLSVHFEIINAVGLSLRWQYGGRHALHAVPTCNRLEKFRRLRTNGQRSCSARGPATSMRVTSRQFWTFTTSTCNWLAECRWMVSLASAVCSRLLTE
jgi:hypothetical protein